MSPLITIIIPTYNQPECLDITINSIINNTYANFEVIIIDNGGNDYAPYYSRLHDNIRVFHALPNSKLNFASGINLGIKEANPLSKYILMLNDDIKILKYDYKWLHRLVSTYERYSNIGAIGTTSNNAFGYQNFLSVDEKERVIKTTALCGCCLLIEKDLIQSIGGLDESLIYADDLDLSIRLMNKGYNLYIRTDVFIYHFGSKSYESIYGKYYQTEKFIKVFLAELCIKHGINVTKLII